MTEKSTPRLDLTAPADLTPAQRAVYDAITGGPRASHVGAVPVVDEADRLVGPFAVMALTPGIGQALQQVGAELRFNGTLTDRERELAVLAVAGELACDFERIAHTSDAADAGLTGAQIAAALAGRVAAGMTREEALITRLAHLMTADRNLPDVDYQEAVAVLGTARLAELTWLIGYYSAMVLSLAVFRPVLPESFVTTYDKESHA